MLAATLATACVGASPPASLDEPPPPGAARPPGGEARPVVEMVAPPPARPPLDPGADPRTPLGELRAGYLPVWSPDFDRAFPPQVCGSDWALDAIAEPAPPRYPEILGDAAAAAALAVMRYEWLLSASLAAPEVIDQLCVAVAAVGAARAEGLDLLAAYLAGGLRNAGPAAYPEEVTVVARGPAAALAVACVPGSHPAGTGTAGITDSTAPTGSSGDGEVPGSDPAVAGSAETAAVPGDGTAPGVRLGAYLLATAHGLEDAVADVSYRVSEARHRPAEGCAALAGWAADWDREVQDRVTGGEIWAPVGRTVGVAELCDAPPPGGPDECPRDWSP